MSNNNYFCTCCAVAIESHKAVNCLICGKTYKIECVNISTAEARKIHAKSGLTWSCKDCLNMGNDLLSLKRAIVNLQSEIIKLKTAVATPPAPNTITPILVQEEKIIQEINEREKRKGNLIIYGAKEDGNAKSNDDQLKSDATQIPKILETLEVNENL
ncbi:hypothetical protein Zmor_010251 [Zophobas morio]|uniref:Zinc finger PHD-type domain-containing protein n=1 Tax=Zophobas morio TaxID=2755281 RepID=A0AA38INH3_9CUCU|nr:hypothetical protein Zmor_010251 [Zophobas morio]